MALSSLLILVWAELRSMSYKKEFYKKMPNLVPVCRPDSLVLSWPSSANGCAESCAEGESVRFNRINCSAQVCAWSFLLLLQRDTNFSAAVIMNVEVFLQIYDLRH